MLVAKASTFASGIAAAIWELSGTGAGPALTFRCLMQRIFRGVSGFAAGISRIRAFDTSLVNVLYGDCAARASV
jgi:hypothetical protein